MNIVTLGVNHKSAPVEIRECLAFAEGAIPAALQQLRQQVGLQESMILSTCNRVEIYGTCDDEDETREKLIAFITSFHDLPAARFADNLYYFTNREAVQHIFRVASSLDSMVVGEPQILGQLKEAFALAVDQQTTGLILNKFMHRAFSVAKAVRTKTKIASNAVSVSFAAVELAKKIFDDLGDKTVMLVGAGEMCELAARHFITQGVKQVLVTNRTYQRARQLAEEFNGHAIEFDDFHNQLDRVDILLSSTGSPTYIINPRHLIPALKKRKNQPIFLIDIAVPRDIDPATNDMDGIFLYDVDDLQEVVAENIDQRKHEADRAEALVDHEVDKFIAWIESLQVTPTIKALRRMAEEISQQELKKTLAGLPELTSKEQKKLEAMTRAIVNKILHHPISCIKEQAENGNQLPVEIIRQLYNLNQASEDLEQE
ncbi:MAG: glutamyl-tRNA reductase [Deltaproteobacteria bacterium]|nr:glutamyl-tRNA reductase [Candidatus Anaeroferrophillus wilburensis]MBN2888029.1 glutamyl-tRNA reductase [Deltaproteobacteria bacterium]